MFLPRANTFLPRASNYIGNDFFEQFGILCAVNRHTILLANAQLLRSYGSFHI